jgi:hypothetical protein
MPILPQTFLPFVGGHFMALTLLSAWHYKLSKFLSREINISYGREFPLNYGNHFYHFIDKLQYYGNDR